MIYILKFDENSDESCHSTVELFATIKEAHAAMQRDYEGHLNILGADITEDDEKPYICTKAASISARSDVDHYSWEISEDKRFGASKHEKPQADNITARQIDNMKHMIGFDNRCSVAGRIHRKYEAYRNYFVASDDEASRAQWQLLIDLNFIKAKTFGNPDDKAMAYTLTPQGINWLSSLLGFKIIVIE